MNKKVGKVIWEWILLLLAPPITLIVVIELAKVIFILSTGYGLLFLLAGIITFIAEIIGLINKTKEAFK